MPLSSPVSESHTRISAAAVGSCEEQTVVALGSGVDGNPVRKAPPKQVTFPLRV
jgi:hypothetical protein